jgi:hypothetical protein
MQGYDIDRYLEGGRNRKRKGKATRRGWGFEDEEGCGGCEVFGGLSFAGGRGCS